MTLAVQAPTDAQLVFIWKLCADYHVDRPDVVASKAEASEIIDAIRAGHLRPRPLRLPVLPER